jgi:hypothetical protein
MYLRLLSALDNVPERIPNDTGDMRDTHMNRRNKNALKINLEASSSVDLTFSSSSLNTAQRLRICLQEISEENSIHEMILWQWGSENGVYK